MEIELDKYYNEVVDWAIRFAPRILLFALALFIGFWVIKFLKKVINKAINKSAIDEEISSFLESMTSILLNCTLILVAVPILGVELTSLLGIVAAVGFAIGLALQGFLGNFASGLTIVFFKPYRVGDWVEISESFGKVKAIQIFNTILTTPGQKTLVIPNGQVTDNIITNFSTEGKIKLEITIPIGYQQSFPKIQGIIKGALDGLDIIITQDQYEIGIESYDSHNLNVTVRPYIQPDDYWEATFQVNQAIKKALSANGVEMSYSEGIENGPIGE
ncbi:MAG: mechanosensitive ion channel family protein [Bacteroidota bacterium]